MDGLYNYYLGFALPMKVKAEGLLYGQINIMCVRVFCRQFCTMIKVLNFKIEHENIPFIV